MPDARKTSLQSRESAEAIRWLTGQPGQLHTVASLDWPVT